MEVDHPPAVVCVGLGGTKIEIGLLIDDERFFSSGEILWRSQAEFARHQDAADATRFCRELASLADTLLRKNGLSWADVGIVGVPFPGPQSGKLWYSNNLTRAFLNGVSLEEALAVAIGRLMRRSPVPKVRVLLDAKCDAGGELYHPEGRLYRDLAVRASVINVATGIAAGYACEGQILLSDDDFRTQVCAGYDAGAGQLGRHLWYNPSGGEWSYHYCAEGLTPQVAPPAIRMTDYISGPAVAARLLHQLGDAGLLTSVDPEEAVAAPTLQQIYDEGRHGSLAEWLLPTTLILRSAPAIVAGSLLSWLDAAYDGALGQQMRTVAEALAGNIIADFAGALRAWRAAPGWRDWAGAIVLTGGFGLRFLARSDAEPERSFCCRLQLMMPGTRICRSRLRHATLREAYIFQRQ